MAQVMLRAPLSELCGGRAHAIPGATVSEVLAGLERAYPPIAGWVLDERGRIREHVNVFVNGNPRGGADAGRRRRSRPRAPRDHGRLRVTELLVGTKKGLFRLEGDAGDGFEITARAFAGQAVEYAMRDPRTGRYLASVTSWFYGPPDLGHRRPRRRMAAGRGHDAARGGEASARSASG